MSTNPEKLTQPQHKILKQQALNPCYFSRQRSSSLTELNRGQSTKTTTITVEAQQSCLSDEITTNEPASQYPAPPPWQRVPLPRSNKKRKMSESPPQKATTVTKNRFGNLPLDPKEDITVTKILKPSKPPPIVLSGIEDINELTKLIETVSHKEEYKLKLISKNILHVLIKTSEDYKKIIQLLRDNGLIGHTFTPKDAKCYRFVIKNLHHLTPLEAIAKAVEGTNNKVRGEIINARYGPDKKPTTTFFVNIEPSVNNPLVKKIEYIAQQKVKIEDHRKSKFIVQCQRCQQYGHSKNNCMRPFRCVKCGEGHKTSECKKKDRSTPAKCALCSCDHPANYKGCEIYKEILARRNKIPTHSSKLSSQTKPRERTNLASLPTAQNHVDSDKFSNNRNNTYADVVKGTPPPLQQPQTVQQSNSILEDILAKQSEKMDLLIQQIGSLVGLITTLISKLSK
ncbi:unnamed protein product [Colias eurytheme]|nr:unnamed protein product [Colias eurytheme]